MVIVIEVDDKDFRNFIGRVSRNIPHVSGRMTRGLAIRMANAIKLEAKAKGHYNTGYLVRNIKAKKAGDKVYKVTAPYYIRYLESGTRPHGIPMQAKNVLWARKVGISWKRLYNIIARQGTAQHPFVQGAIIKNLRPIFREQARKYMGTFIASGGRHIPS